MPFFFCDAVAQRLWQQEGRLASSAAFTEAGDAVARRVQARKSAKYGDITISLIVPHAAYVSTPVKRMAAERESEQRVVTIHRRCRRLSTKSACDFAPRASECSSSPNSSRVSATPCRHLRIVIAVIANGLRSGGLAREWSHVDQVFQCTKGPRVLIGFSRGSRRPLSLRARRAAPPHLIGRQPHRRRQHRRVLVGGRGPARVAVDGWQHSQG